MSCDNMKSLYKHKKEKNSPKTKERYSVCLICGRHGCHDIFITNFTNHLSSSGTQLAKFLAKIIGEEPCYSISQLICQQCYLLLDRLDTYQCRATEISDYISSRYKETKIELVGSRQRISDLIVSSLSNIRSFKSGTTLNVCDELSVTVFYDSLLRREPKSPNSTLGNNNNILKSGNSNHSPNPNNIANNKNVKLKRKRTSSNTQNLIKKQKWTALNNNNTNNNNNNNVNNSNNNNNVNNFIEDSKSNYYNELISESPLLNSVQKSGDPSESESEGSAKEEVEGSDGGSTNSNSSELKRLECPNPKSSSNSSDKSSSSSSSTSDSSSSSSASSTSSTSSDDSEEDDNVNAVKTENVSNEIPDEITSMEEPELTRKIKQEIQSEEELPITNHDMQNFNGKEEIGAIESHLAEAVLTQGSFASNLFESFLSTSFWMNNTPDSVNQKSFASLTKQQQKQNQTLQAQCVDDDDMTVQSLSAAATSINDKKTRLELKNTGRSYINTKGKIIEAKRVWPQDCSRCLLRCNNRLSEETRLEIFSAYWSLGDYDLQREYLARHMEREERVGPSGLSRTVVLYYLTYDKQKYQVCRQFFLKTLDVSEKASRIVLEKKLKGELGVKVSVVAAAATEEINNGDEVST